MSIMSQINNMTVKRVEEFVVWQESRVVAREVYKMTANFKDWNLKDQMRRAAVSMAANIAEGYEKQSDDEFARYLYISKGSSGELRTLLIIARDVGHLSEVETEKLIKQAAIISGRLSRLITYLKKPP